MDNDKPAEAWNLDMATSSNAEQGLGNVSLGGGSPANIIRSVYGRSRSHCISHGYREVIRSMHLALSPRKAEISGCTYSTQPPSNYNYNGSISLSP